MSSTQNGLRTSRNFGLEADDKHGEMTIGMVVEMITKHPDWMDHGIGEVSTREVEKGALAI